MKSLELDGVVKNFDGAKAFGAIAQEIRAELAPERVVTEIFVDGKSVDLMSEDDLNAKVFNEIGHVTLKSRNVKDLFLESIGMAPKICQALLMDCGDVQTFIGAKDYNAVNERVAEMTSLLDWLLQLMSGLQALGKVPLDQITYSKGRLTESIDRMQVNLEHLHQELSDQNWPAFETRLNREFKEEIEHWNLFFTEATSNFQSEN